MKAFFSLKDFEVYRFHTIGARATLYPGKTLEEVEKIIQKKHPKNFREVPQYESNVMSDKIKFTKEQEDFIQQWTALYHEVGEFYHIPYYFKKIRPADPLKDREVLWEIVSHKNLPDEIKVMLLEMIDLITVCDKCLRASCWQGVYLCDENKTAGTIEKSIHELKKLELENPEYWERKYDSKN